MTSSHRFLYERAKVHQGYLIVPFQYSQVAGAPIYSYRLLALDNPQHQFHTATNPAGIYAGQVETIVTIAQDHLDQSSDSADDLDYFQQQYVYQHNLIIISAIGDKVFYDHYPPEQLTNIAAPKIFASEPDCIAWVKQGIDQFHPKSAPTI